MMYYVHVLDAPNCLLSISRLDEAGGHVEFRNGECTLKDKKENIIGKGNLSNRLYLLEARAQLSGKETTNYASPNKLTWGQ